MSQFDNLAGSTRVSGLVPLPELVPFMEQVSKVARFITATSKIGTAAVYPELSTSIQEGACLIKEYRDKHAKALSELEKQTSEWTTSIDLREAEIGALNQRKGQVELELTTKHADLVRLQSNLDESEKLLQDAKSQLELAKADLTSTERQRKDRQVEMTNLQLEEESLRAIRAKEELRLQKRATEIEIHDKSVYTREEQVKFRETNVKAGEDAVLSREVQSNMARIQAEKDRDQLKVEIEALSTQKGDLEEQAKHIRANLTRQLRELAERNSRLDQRRDAIEQLTERSIAQKEDLESRQIEVEEATKVSEAMRYDLEGLRKKLQMEQISIYADRKALEQGQQSIEREHQTVVTYAKGLEETVLKKDPAYVPPEIEDAEIRTATISSALVARFDNITAQLREQREVDDTSLKEMESKLRLAEDRHLDLIELERKGRECNEEFKKNLNDALLERDELQKRLTDIKEQKVQLDDQYNELLCQNDTVKKSHQRKGEELKTEQTQCAELRQHVAGYLRAQHSANELVANLQSKYDQICQEVDARKVSELEYQKALGDERIAHVRTKGAYSELDKRIAAADKGTRSAQEELAQLRAQHSSTQRELIQLTAQHSSAQLRVEALQNKIQELTAWKEKTTESLSSLTAVRADKEHLQTENRRLQEERKTSRTELEAKQKRIEALEARATYRQILSDAASGRQVAQDGTIEDLQNTIIRLRRPRDSEHVAQRERRLMPTMGEFATSRHHDNAEQTRPVYPLPGSSEMGLDDGYLSRPSSPRLPQAKRRRTGPKEVPRRSTNVDDGGKRLGLGVRDEDEEARRIGEFPDADKSADCVIAKLTSIRNGTDDTALPVEVKERLLEQLKYWDGRTRDWASRLQPKNAEVKCCEHVVQRKACQWHNDEEELLDCYRACPFCARTGRYASS